MTLDATFWVTISFLIFVGILIYFKIPQKVKSILEQNILNMLLDHSVINDNQLSKINSTSNEVGMTKLETAIELYLANNFNGEEGFK